MAELSFTIQQQDDTPIEGVTVIVGETYHAVSDADGIAVMSNVTPGTYTYIAYDTDYYPTSGTIDIVDATEATITPTSTSLSILPSVGTTEFTFRIPFNIDLMPYGTTINLLSFKDSSNNLLYLTKSDGLYLTTNDGNNELFVTFESTTPGGVYTAYLLTNANTKVLELAIYDHQTDTYSVTIPKVYSGTYDNVSEQLDIAASSDFPIHVRDIYIQPRYCTPWSDGSAKYIDFDTWTLGDYWADSDAWLNSTI